MSGGAPTSEAFPAAHGHDEPALGIRLVVAISGCLRALPEPDDAVRAKAIRMASAVCITEPGRMPPGLGCFAALAGQARRRAMSEPDPMSEVARVAWLVDRAGRGLAAAVVAAERVMMVERGSDDRELVDDARNHVARVEEWAKQAKALSGPGLSDRVMGV